MGAWEIQCSDEEKADIRSLRCLMKIECCVIPFLRGHTEVSNVYRIVDFLYPRFSVPCCHLESILRRQWLRRYQARSRQLVQRDSVARDIDPEIRSEEHTSELQSLMRISYAVFCLKKKKPIMRYTI